MSFRAAPGCSMSSSASQLTSTLQLIALLPAMVLAAAFDLHHRRIPNGLVAAIAAGGIVVALLVGGWTVAGERCVSAAAAALACGPLYWVRGLAGGDIKLVTAGAFWLTLAELLVALAAIAICGAVLAAGYLMFSRDVTHLPYAVAIAGGTGIAVWIF